VDRGSGRYRPAATRSWARKERITIRLNADILEWFRQQATAQGGGNYQTMINQALPTGGGFPCGNIWWIARRRWKSWYGELTSAQATVKIKSVTTPAIVLLALRSLDERDRFF